jgi:small-conductance mechanosensitive channel
LNLHIDPALMVAFATFVVALLVFLVVRTILLNLLDRKITEQVSFAYVFLKAVRFPSLLWCLAAALAIAIQNANVPSRVAHLVTKGIGAFSIISVSMVVAAVLVNTIGVHGRRYNMSFAVAGLSRTLTNVVVFSIAALLLLDQVFEIAITPILTALGVGGLAVALALQDTLANFFAGVHILIEEPIVVGDFIKLSTGEEGIVKDIGWRTTRIQSAGSNITVIPNTKITSSTLTNFSLPDKRVGLDIALVAALEADHNRVAEIALDVASETEGVLEDPAPSVMFDPGVTPTSLQMKLSVHVATHFDRGPVGSTIRRRLFERFREERVPLPPVERR